MNDSLLTRALNMVDAAAAQLGVGVDYLWPILIRRMVAEGIMDLALITAGWIIAINAGRRAWNYLKAQHEKPSYDQNEAGMFFSGLCAGGALLFMFICTLCCLSATVLQIVTPEIAAIQFVLRGGL